MLAREIHDVAGEIDSVSPAATDPGALVQTTILAFTFSKTFNTAQHRRSVGSVFLLQLEERAFNDSVDEGGPAQHDTGGAASNGQSAALRRRTSGGQSSHSIRRQTWNREDVSVQRRML